MAKIITSCPSCQSGTVKVTKIECESCGTKFEGDFDVPKLLKLSADDLLFVEQFLLSSGSLKKMAEQMDVSYPTVRNRLNQVIEDVEQMAIREKSSKEKSREHTSDKILSLLEKGSISAKEAAKRLREV